jgi:ABC-type multidrug transport system fused ATPase/permease subunit
MVNSQYDGDIAASNVLMQANIISILFIIIMVGLSLYLYTIKKLTTPEVTSICIMLVLFFKYCDSALYKIKLNTQCIGKMYEINNYFNDFKIKKQNPNMFVIKDKENAEIRFIDVSLTYKNKVVFNKLNIIFTGSKKTILLGPNGVGKSTILKLIAGLLEYSGTITMNGKNIKNYNYDSIMKHIGYIQQQPKLFNRTIYENLNYGSNYTKEQIYEFVIKFGLKSFFDKFPNLGIFTVFIF